MNKQANVLMGWKAIAQYVGVSVRTLQRWETQFKFPVHRVPDGMAYSMKPEVDSWLVRQDGVLPKMMLEGAELGDVEPHLYVNKQPVAWKCTRCSTLFHASVAMKSHPEDPLPLIKKQIEEHDCRGTITDAAS